MPKVSVIVPVYNVEKYIPACVDSILAQSLTDIEIICVDDGSTDASPAILDEYARRDGRVKVIHKPNAGYGNAINTGFDAAKGEYIGIVEGDDYILPKMYETLYRYASLHDLDLIKSECIQFWDRLCYERRVHVNEMEPYFGKVLQKEDRILFYQFYMNTWSGIYKRSFLAAKGIRHNETPGASYQDNGFWIQTMSMCGRAMWLDQAFYMYRQDNPAASVKSREKVLAMYEEYRAVERILEKAHLEKELTICRYYRLLRHKGTFIRISEEFKEEYAQLIFQDWDRFYEEIKDLDIRSKEDLFAWIRDLRSEGRVSRMIRENLEVRKRIDDCSQLMIYGAGVWAEYVCLKLFSMGCYDKVTSIRISHKTEKKSLCGRPVLLFDADMDYTGVLVVIGVDSRGRAYQEIEKTLQKNGVKDYMDADTIFYNFYMA